MATKKRQRDGQKRQRFGKAPPPALRFCLFVDKDGQPPVFATENRQKIELFSKNVALHKTAARNCAQCTIPGGHVYLFYCFAAGSCRSAVSFSPSGFLTSREDNAIMMASAFKEIIQNSVNSCPA